MTNPSGLPYTPAVRAGDWLVVSGQIGLEGNALVPGGFEAELRQSLANLQARLDELAALNGGAQAWPNQLIGTPEEVAANMQRYLDIGYRHLICGFPAPFDMETMERMQAEVRPQLRA